MPDSPRLLELRRQRQLLHEHAAWLDREIAREEAAGAAESTIFAPAENPSAAAPGTPSSESPVVGKGIENDATTAHAEAIMDEYRTPASDLQRDVRAGCFLYFAAALLILAAVVVALYFILRH